MTSKQERILSTALQMFADSGYHATSTSKIARAAGVSEGLIFRHYINKEGLLEAIMDEARQRLEVAYEQLLSPEVAPREALKEILSMPFHISEDELHFWKLLYALKWQADEYDRSMTAPVKARLLRIFELLNYRDPEAEAETVLLIIDGIATSVMLRKPENKEAIMKSILSKYRL